MGNYCTDIYKWNQYAVFKKIQSGDTDYCCENNLHQVEMNNSCHYWNVYHHKWWIKLKNSLSYDT